MSEKPKTQPQPKPDHPERSRPGTHEKGLPGHRNPPPPFPEKKK